MAKRDTNAHPLAPLNLARRYYKLATLGFDENDSDLETPLYFLYFHTVELLLKCYLAANGKHPRDGHKITHYLRQAEQIGLKIPGDRLDLSNVVSLLESGNQGSGFRYFTPQSGSIPELKWTHDVVGRLLGIVAQSVKTPSGSLPTNAVKLQIKFSKPT